MVVGSWQRRQALDTAGYGSACVSPPPTTRSPPNVRPTAPSTLYTPITAPAARTAARQLRHGDTPQRNLFNVDSVVCVLAMIAVVCGRVVAVALTHVQACVCSMSIYQCRHKVSSRVSADVQALWDEAARVDAAVAESVATALTDSPEDASRSRRRDDDHSTSTSPRYG